MNGNTKRYGSKFKARVGLEAIKEGKSAAELAGKYGEVYRELYNQPRVYKSKDKPWKAGPVIFHKGIINPQHAMATQAIQTELDTLAPGGHSKVIDTAI